MQSHKTQQLQFKQYPSTIHDFVRSQRRRCEGSLRFLRFMQMICQTKKRWSSNRADYYFRFINDCCWKIVGFWDAVLRWSVTRVWIPVFMTLGFCRQVYCGNGTTDPSLERIKAADGVMILLYASHPGCTCNLQDPHGICLTSLFHKLCKDNR